ncbi:hypothetical protein GF362_00540 [Candidatus Dojkabacteria bacterium]|nr:hypothetical protein [Candidatus Dojkabacteria bacterium]
MKIVISPRYFAKDNNNTIPKHLESLLILGLCLSFFIIVIIGFVFYELHTYAESIPPIDEIRYKVTEKGENSLIYDRNGQLLYVFKDPHRDREYIEFDDIPNSLIWALIAAEDEIFFEHEGLDYVAILRSAFIYFKSGGKQKVGGSTITQQLTKNTILSNEKTFDRKIKEMLVTFFIEKEYTKEYILELYLNSASFGGRIRGIKSAARVYFNKDIDELTLNESVFLISLIQTPGKASPLFSSNEQLAWDIVETRRKYIFKQLKRNLIYIRKQDPAFYTYEEVLEAESEIVSLNPDIGDIKAPHFVFYVKEILENEPYNISEEELYNGGYHIYTSLDLELQNLAEAKLKEGIEKKKHYWMNNASMVMLDPKSSEILVLVGSKDYWAERSPDGRFDPHVNVTLSSRNLGSSIKPFLVYEAFENNYYSPYSIIYDSPIYINGFSPKNSDGSFMGQMTVAEALIKSRNTPFVRMIQKVGVNNFLDLLELLEYKSASEDRDRYGLSISLGGFESNLLEHTHAYTALANNGNMADLRPILRIEDSKGKLIQETNINESNKLNSDYVKMLNGILREYGPAKIAGKTGTTDANRDNYFIGYNDKFVIGIWVGNNNNARMHPYAFGSTTALPIWSGFYNDLINQYPEYESNWVDELPHYKPVVVNRPVENPMSSPIEN